MPVVGISRLYFVPLCGIQNGSRMEVGFIPVWQSRGEIGTLAAYRIPRPAHRARALRITPHTQHPVQRSSSTHRAYSPFIPALRLASCLHVFGSVYTSGGRIA